MKRITLYALPFMALPVMGQDALAPATVLTDTGIQSWILNTAVKYPGLSSTLIAIGILRVALKPIMAAVESYVKQNVPNHYDDLIKFENRPGFKWFCYIMDLLGSVKVAAVVSAVTAPSEAKSAKPEPVVIPPAGNSGFARPATLMFAALASAALLLSLVLFSGCTTVGNGGTTTPAFSLNTNTGVVSVYGRAIDPVKTAKAVQIAARVGTVYGINKDPNAKPYLQAACALVDDVVNSGNYDPALLQASLDKISMSDIRDSADIKAAIETAFAVYSIYSGGVMGTALSQDLYLRPVLLALSAGIKDGLGYQIPK